MSKKTVPRDVNSQNTIRWNQYRDFVELMLKKQHGVNVDAFEMLLDDDIRSQVQKKGSVRLDNGIRFIKCTRNEEDYCCLFQVEGEWCCSGRCRPKKGFWKYMGMTDDWHWENPGWHCSYRLMNKPGFDEDREAEYIYNKLATEGDYTRKKYEPKNY